MMLQEESRRNLVKENLEEAIPSLVALVNGGKFPWDKIDRLFNAEVDKRLAACKGETITVEACIYDIIIAARKQKPQAIRLLRFINKLFEDLTVTLQAAEKPLIKHTIRQMLESLDGKYLNFVGELATLNSLLKSGNYRLVGMEDKMPNGKFIDFKLKQVGQDKFQLVEVFNIQLDNNRVVDDVELIRKRLMHKLSKKIEDKKARLSSDVSFCLIPVIWGGWEDIRVYSEFFKAHKLELPEVTEPLAYLTLHDGADYCEHHFAPISTLFESRSD
jgi:hypothetical protein